MDKEADKSLFCLPAPLLCHPERSRRILNPMEFSIFLRIHLLDFQEGVHDAGNQDGGPAVEAPDHRLGDLSLRSGVGYSDPGEEDREKVADETSGVAKQRLDRIGLGLLLLVHHVTDHHLERLHGHVDGCVKEYEGEKAEPHGTVQAKDEP